MTSDVWILECDQLSSANSELILRLVFPLFLLPCSVPPSLSVPMLHRPSLFLCCLTVCLILLHSRLLVLFVNFDKPVSCYPSPTSSLAMCKNSFIWKELRKQNKRQLSNIDAYSVWQHLLQMVGLYQALYASRPTSCPQLLMFVTALSVTHESNRLPICGFIAHALTHLKIHLILLFFLEPFLAL